MTLYEVLGLSTEATAAQIKAAHRRAVKTHHPDVGGDARKFEQVQRAYFTLSDPDRRARYDRTGTEDDAAAATEEQLAQSSIAKLIVQYISGSDDLNTTDIIAAIRRTFLQQESRLHEACRQFDLRIERVEILRRRLHRKNDEHGTLSALLNERERELQVAKSKEQAQLGVLSLALRMLDDYTYKIDPSPAEEAKIWMSLKP